MHTSDQLLAEMNRLHPKSIDLSLSRINRLLAKLGSPHRRVPALVHVAGTNGKGSVTAFLKAILEAAGKRVHVYTSPHLVRFHERIELAAGQGGAKPITERQLRDVLGRVLATNAGDCITQFEITTAAAFLAFSEHAADFSLVEVGLGGRLDATNVVKRPELTIITSIGIDHADFLGGTIEEIAYEKAGIIKPSVRCILGGVDPVAKDVVHRTASKVGAEVIAWGDNYYACERRERFSLWLGDRLLDLPKPHLLGRHQIRNAATAIRAAQELLGAELNQGVIERGLASVRWPARMQRLETGSVAPGLCSQTELWLDGGHNVAAGEVIAATMASMPESSTMPLFLIVGMFANKDAAGFLKPLRGMAEYMIAVPIQSTPYLAHAPQNLVRAAEANGLPAECAPSWKQAVHRLQVKVPGRKRILICGSLQLAGDVLKASGGMPQIVERRAAC